MPEHPLLPVVAVNLNLRLDGNLTMVNLDEDVENGPLLPGAEVEVRAPGLVGRGEVVAVEEAERTAYVRIYLASMNRDDTV